MKRLMTTTAAALLLASPAFAQTGGQGFGNMTEISSSDFYASDLIGMRVYNTAEGMDVTAPVMDGAEKEWEDIGEVNDIIIGQDGQVQAVILGVGGFLGMGERDVAVSMDTIKVVREEGDSNDRFLMVTTDKDMLGNAPAYDYGVYTPESRAMATDAAANDAATADTPADGAMKRPMLTRPAIEREGYAEVTTEKVHELTADDLEGATVYGLDDEDVGSIDSIVLGEDGKVQNVVINVGGFLGMGEKPIAVTFDELQILRNTDSGDLVIYIDSTEDALKAQPEYTSD